MIKLSNQKNVALEVNVTNLNGDDAYEASMVAAFLSSLTYSEFRVPLNVSLVSSLTSLMLVHQSDITRSLVLIPKEAPGVLYS